MVKWIYGGLILVMLNGCFPKPKIERSPLDNLNRVEHTYKSFFLNWPTTQDAPSQREISALIKFLKPYQRHDNTHVYIEQSSVHSNIQQKWLKESVHDYSQLRMNQVHFIPFQQTYKNTGFKIHIESFIMHTPDCIENAWKYGSADVDSMPTLGCTTNANLGLMISDPRDLVQGSESNQVRVAPLAQVIKDVYENKFTPFAGSASSSSSKGSASSSTPSLP